ncbi:MAG: ribosome assembly factor SBDS [Candidatus Woesearchaeota archaeon]
MAGITYDKERIHINVARLRKGSEKFEIDVDPDKAIAYKNGQISDINEVLKAKKIFSDAKKGMEVSEKILETIFKTSDPLEVANIILKNGEIQLTEEYRKKMRELKIKKIISIIHRNGVDPKTHLPHPMTRLENAIEQAKVKIDDYKPAEMQVQDVLKKLRVVLPIKFEIKEVAIKISSEYAAKSYNLVKEFGTILKDEWLTDGSWLVVIDIPGGLENDFYDKLNNFTHGNIESKVLKIK